MSKLDEIDEHGWAESREDNDGKSVSMRVLPWSDYVLLTKAVRQLGAIVLDEYGSLLEAKTELDPDVLELIGGEE